MAPHRRTRSALTLMELLVVLVILAALAGIVVPLLSTSTKDAGSTVTLANIQSIKNAVLAYSLDMKGMSVLVQGQNYPANVTNVFGAQPNSTGLPLTIKDLLIKPTGVNGQDLTFDPISKRGWRGPYLTGLTSQISSLVLHSSFNDYVQSNDPAVLDGWSRPIVIQWVTNDVAGTWVRLVSAGQPGVLDTPVATANLSTTNPAWQVNDDIVIYMNQPLSFAPK